jgi:glycosyltransferase involved in cell wall biosynthesis
MGYQQMQSTTHQRRVLFINPQPFMALRGSAFRVQTTIKAIVELGYSVDLLVYPYGDYIDIKGVTIYRSRKVPWIKAVPIGPSWQKLMLDFYLFLSAIKLKCANSYSAIHGIEEAGIMAGLLGKVSKTPFVFDMHSRMSEQIKERKILGAFFISPIMSWIEGVCVKNAAAVITVSDKITSWVKIKAPDTISITVEDIPLETSNTLDTALKQNIIRDYALIGRKVLLYTGNFESYQGIDLLLDSFKNLITNNKEIQATLLLVGGTSERDAQTKKYMKYVLDNNLQDVVIFLGPRPQQEMGTFMSIADVLISPRIVGTNTPLKVYSYMAAEKPIVATLIDAHIDVLDDSSAYISEPNVEAFSKAMYEALDDSDDNLVIKKSKVLAAKRTVQERFSWNSFINKLRIAYNFIYNPEKKTINQ